MARKATIISKFGACDGELFEKMVERGDIQASKITELVDAVVTIRGVATVHIETSEKEFDITYYATDDGYFTTGSEYFKDSVMSYIDNADTFKISKIKTKKGFTFKATPVLSVKNPIELD